jgi:hypothetical protein
METSREQSILIGRDKKKYSLGNQGPERSMIYDYLNWWYFVVTRGDEHLHPVA